MTDLSQTTVISQAGSNNSAAVSNSGSPSTNAESNPAAPGISIKLAGETIEITKDNIGEVDFITIQSKCKAHVGNLVVDISGHSQFEQPNRLRLSMLFNGIKPTSYAVNGQNFDDLMTAYLSQIKPGMPPTALYHLKGVAIEVAAVLFFEESSVTHACHLIQQKLKDVNEKGFKIKDLQNDMQRIKRLIDALLRKQESQQLSKVRDCSPDAPVGEELLLPSGWFLTEGGIQKPYGKITGTLQFSVFPIAISNEESGRQAVLLKYQSQGSWRERWVDRLDIADKCRCIQLANYGIDITTNNACLWVEFFADYIRANEKVLPLIQTVSHMGFVQVNESNVFVLGHSIITAESILDLKNSTICTTGALQTSMMFRSDHDGLMQRADAYCQRGAYDNWLEAVVSLMQFPIMRFLLMASFASPVLEIVKSPNFNISVAGPTSCGKTTALMVCASAWGHCAVNDALSLISTWNSTPTYLERVRLFGNNLPVFFDETKLAKGNEQEIAKTIYASSTGKGRDRGTKWSIAKSDSARNITFITGEQPATSFGEDGGAAARTLDIWGSPFGGSSPETGNLVRKVSSVVVSNYGHAGPKFVQYLLKHSDQWDAWAKRYSHFENTYVELAGTNVVAGRLASNLATIALTSELVHKALEFPGDWIDPVIPIWDEVIRATAEADHPKKAMLVAYNYFISNPSLFQKGADHSEFFTSKFIGRWEPLSSTQIPSSDDDFNFEWIGFLPDHLEKVLKENGFSSSAIVKQWKAVGWLVTDNEQDTTRNQKKTSLNGKPCRVIAISSAAIATAHS